MRGGEEVYNGEEGEGEGRSVQRWVGGGGGEKCTTVSRGRGRGEVYNGE